MELWVRSAGVSAESARLVVDAIEAAGVDDPSLITDLDQSGKDELLETLKVGGVKLGDRTKIKKAFGPTGSGLGAQIHQRRPAVRSPSPNPVAAVGSRLSDDRFREIFDEVDMDRSGTINWYELQLALSKCGQDGSKAKDMVRQYSR